LFQGKILEIGERARREDTIKIMSFHRNMGSKASAVIDE
jgi:hypothetical protein